MKPGGQVKLGLAVDLVREVVRAVALGGGLGGESGDLGDQRGRGGRGLARGGLGPALIGSAHGHDHRGVEAGLLDEQPDGDQAQHGQNAETGQLLGGAHFCLSPCHKSSEAAAYWESFLPWFRS